MKKLLLLMLVPMLVFGQLKKPGSTGVDQTARNAAAAAQTTADGKLDSSKAFKWSFTATKGDSIQFAAGTGITLTQSTNQLTITSQGLRTVPAYSNDTTQFLRGDSSWVTPAAAGLGDITAVSVTSPVTGGGSSGAVTIGVDTTTYLATIYDVSLKANSAITVSAGTGLTGGGSLSANRTISLDTTLAYIATQADVNLMTPLTRTISAGAGLAGGGTLASDRTLSVDSTSFVATDYQVGLRALTSSLSTDSSTTDHMVMNKSNVMVNVTIGSGLSLNTTTRTLTATAGGAGDTTLGWFSVTTYGAVGNGSTNDSAAIADAFAAASADGGGTVYFPNATYVMGSQLVPSNVYIYSDNATLKARTGSGANTYLLRWDGVNNSGVSGTLILDGNRTAQAYKADDGHVPLWISGNSYNLDFDNIIISSAAGDGIYFGPAGAAPHNIWFGSVRIDSAYRNGISIVNAYDIHFVDVDVKNTVGTSPQAGIDIEPNTAADSLHGITFERAVLHHNGTTGFEIFNFDTTGFAAGAYQGAHHGVQINYLDAHNNGTGVYLHHAQDFAILGGTLHDNTNYGLTITCGARDVRVNAEIWRNGDQGIQAYLTDADMYSYNWDFSGCRVHDNGIIGTNKSGIQLHAAAYEIRNVALRNVWTWSHTTVGIQLGSNIGMIDWSGSKTWSNGWEDDRAGARTDVKGAFALDRGVDSVASTPTTGIKLYVRSGGSNRDTLFVIDQKGNIKQLMP